MARYTLNPEILYAAYTQGYFPMPDAETGEILWFRPDPRGIIPLDGFHVSASLGRTLKRGHFHVTFDQAFCEVMEGCAAREDTWISEEFMVAYGQLHALGSAHSVEVWHSGKLAGGAYGVSIGGAFFAESMFTRVTDASKVALWHLVDRLKRGGFALLECQFLTEHLASLGAIEVPDAEYMGALERAIQLRLDF